MKVSLAGRNRVLNTHRKNVHSWIQGSNNHIFSKLHDLEIKHALKLKKRYGILRYNPYVAPYFFDETTKEKIEWADEVIFDIRPGLRSGKSHLEYIQYEANIHT